MMKNSNVKVKFVDFLIAEVRKSILDRKACGIAFMTFTCACLNLEIMMSMNL